MNLYTFAIIISLCAESTLCFQNDITTSQPSSGESVILGKIIRNYLKKYYSDAKIFISIIFPSSKKGNQRFFDDFFINFFNDPKMEMLDRNILSKLDNSIHENRLAFNLILVEDSESLQLSKL